MKTNYRILSLIMALTVLLSTVGVTVSKHLCGGEVRDIAFFHDAEPCEHFSEPVAIQCPVHEDMVIQQEGRQDHCCTDTKEVLKDDHPKDFASSGISIQPHYFILFACNLFISHTDTQNRETGSLFSDLTVPPLINQVKYILVNVFRL